MQPGPIRHDWSRDEIVALFERPFNDLLFMAQTAHRAHFDANSVQLSTLLSIKTGACPEDCKYCPQSIRYDTGLEREALMEVEDVLAAARAAKEAERAAEAEQRATAAKEAMARMAQLAKDSGSSSSSSSSGSTQGNGSAQGLPEERQLGEGDSWGDLA